MTWRSNAAAAAKSLQSCPTLCDPIDDSPPASTVPESLQARTLEWVATAFSNAWQWKVKVKSLSRVRLLATPWTAAHQAPPSMGFSRQSCWSGVPFFLFYFALKTDILIGVKWYLIVVLIFISLMISESEWLISYLLAICVSSLKGCVYKSSVHF